MKVKVRAGDTLSYYGRLFSLDLQLLIDSNPTIAMEQLKVGQIINIPGFTSEPHTIKQADTLWKLAENREIPLDALLLLNQDIALNHLSIGGVIDLPKKVTRISIQGKQHYDSSILERDMEHLKQLFPFIQIESIGQSVLGKSLQAIRIGRGPKKVHINASFHANEWITSGILMKSINEYLLSLIHQQPIRGIQTLPLYHQVELTVVPMVNPDGVDLVIHGPPAAHREKLLALNGGNDDFTEWKANIRGIDLNNQFPANWEIEKERKLPKSPAPRDYPGDAPLTEPEGIAMARLAENQSFDRVVAYHTQGAEFYWGYEGLEPFESSAIATEFSRVSGYKAIRYIDSHAGYKDWFIQEYQRPGFTIELGKGVNPLPLSQFDDIYEAMIGLFLASLYM